MNDNSLLVSVTCFTIMYIFFQLIHFYENYGYILNSNHSAEEREQALLGAEDGSPTVPRETLDPTRRCVALEGKVYLFSERGLAVRDSVPWPDLEQCKEHVLDTSRTRMPFRMPTEPALLDAWTKISRCDASLETC